MGFIVGNHSIKSFASTGIQAALIDQLALPHKRARRMRAQFRRASPCDCSLILREPRSDATHFGHMLRALLRKGVPTLLATSAAGFGYVYSTDEGTRRSVTFWREAFPIYVHYRSV